MSAHQGDSAPDVFVFPPFAPPSRQDAPAAPPPVEASTPAATPAEPEPYGFEVPLPAHDVGEPEEPVRGGPEALPWGAADEPAAPAAPQSGDDLPWLEMPAGGPTIHATEEAGPAPAADPAAPEAAPTWMAWESGASSVGETAAEITPPPLATAGQLTSVSAVPAPSQEAGAPELAPKVEPFGFSRPDPYAPTTGAAHPETLPQGEAPAPHSWPVEAMEPAALQSAEASPVVQTPVAPDAVAVHAPAVDHSAFGHLAERLEAIARAMRNDPGGFVALHHDDPLALLIAGYALGYRQGSKAP